MSAPARAAAAPARIGTIELRPGQVALWWLGQSGFLVRGPRATVLVDAFLADHPDRAYPPPFRPEDATGIDVLVCTHDHLDHLDADSLPSLAEASPDAAIVVPEPLVDRVTALGISHGRVQGARAGAPRDRPGVVLHPVPACHGDEPEDAYTFGRERGGGLDRFLGFVLDLDGVHVYHAGDTIPYAGMAESLAALRVDLALLPVNGRDAEREAQGIVGNLDEREAVALAAAIGADLLVPMHWDLFPANPGSPERVVEEARRTAPELAVLLPTRARPFVYAAAGPR